MTTVQIVGIVVAATIVLLLVIALLVTRRRGSAGEAPAAATHASFLDDAPQDTLSALGKAEQPMEDITIDPAVHRQIRRAGESPAPAPPDAAARREPRGNGLGLDWGPSGDAPAFAVASAAADAFTSPAAPPDAETTGELPAAGPAAAVTATQDPVTEGGVSANGPAPARPSEGGPAAEAGPASGPRGRLVPLSDIIVTTSNKMVDLQDPEVRRMLTNLVKDEIDQATYCRQQGQTIDAVLQLTEAEKISRALDMRESAAAIRKMMDDLRGQV